MEECVKVRLIEQKGDSALVEWMEDGCPQRAYVPPKLIEGGEVDDEALGTAPYGAPWAELIDLSGVTPEGIQKALREAGIWTPDDLRRFDRTLIRIATDTIGAAVWAAARACEQGKRRKK